MHKYLYDNLQIMVYISNNLKKPIILRKVAYMRMCISGDINVKRCGIKALLSLVK